MAAPDLVQQLGCVWGFGVSSEVSSRETGRLFSPPVPQNEPPGRIQRGRDRRWSPGLSWVSTSDEVFRPPAIAMRWEDRRVRSRFCFLLIACTLASAGCGDVPTGSITYREHERLAKDLGAKPKLRAAVRKTLAEKFGETVQEIKIPTGTAQLAGIRSGGYYLANHAKRNDENIKLEEAMEVEGGYSLYRKHCLHCHGVFGAGDGPTADFLYPRPRDYRKGVYKFTSTNPTNAKPTRADLKKTILYGLHGTSMPGFEALMAESEIEQVIDYVIFLSIRGEVEQRLIDEVAQADEPKEGEKALEDEVVNDIITTVFSSWSDDPSVSRKVIPNPKVARVAATPESIQRGKELFLGINRTGNKLECAGCHGPQAKGNGTSFIDPQVTQDVVFRLKPLDVAIHRLYEAKKNASASHGDAHGSESHEDPAGVLAYLKNTPPVVNYLREKRNMLPDVPAKDFATFLDKNGPEVSEAALKLVPALADPEFRPFLASQIDLWIKGSLDDWGNALRPANLQAGVYKGGRRPIDLYWRIAKGINGAKMPAHASLLSDEQIWDVVNFVLELPHDPGLLKDAEALQKAAGAKPAASTAMATPAAH